jgi:FkbM family methyltransferase
MLKRLKERLHAGFSPLLYGDGFSIVPRSVKRQWPQRAFLRRYLKQLEVDCVLDVGANVGQYGSELRRIGYQGRILSFEPDPSCYACLEQVSSRDPLWSAYNIALGSKAGEATLNLMAVSLFNSFQSPMVSETASFEKANAVVEQQSVRVETLSDLWPTLQQRFGLTNVFLKMDTQGFDLQVFNGAAAIHDKIAGLQTEIGLKRLYKGVPHWAEAINSYLQCGFELTGIFPVNPQDGELVELDCYFRHARKPT